MLLPDTDYTRLCSRFRWTIPERLNMGTAVSDVHADGTGRLALIYEDPAGRVERYTFDDLSRLSSRVANVLAALGVRKGDRVAILLPQRPETAIAHIATYKAGAVAVPLFTQFGPDALEYRLGHAQAKVLVTDAEDLPKVEEIRGRLPDLEHVLVVDDETGGHASLPALVARAADRFAAVDTLAEDPALIVYTSGTTGPPKGALHAHRTLLGHIPGVQMPQAFFPQPGDRFWTPADWAWIGGLLDALLPSLYFGVPVVAHRARKFDPERAFHLMAVHGIRNAFMPPTALKLMRQVERPSARYGYAMRSIGSGGESLGEEVLEWARGTFGIDVNEFYGQTEANLVVSNCSGLFPVRPGSMGRPVPGHTVEVVSPEGTPLAPGETGVIAVRRPDPVMFLGYWRDPEATARKFAGDFCLTGDRGSRDADGYLTYRGREDDVIKSGAYRIGPAEIEDGIMRHPAVAMVAVVGSPDPVRGEVVKAFVVRRPGPPPDDQLAAEITALVRERLAPYQCPREVEFVESLPMTATGKIRRRELREAERRRKGLAP
ncbi:MAG TPA: acyl-CoA synthetase [Thermodesulfobacteriota bacterium]